MKRPALVRCVVISTSAGYSVKNGAAVVGRCHVVVSCSCSSDTDAGGVAVGSALVVVNGGKYGVGGGGVAAA